MFETDKPIISLLTLRRDLYLVTSLLLADKEVAKMPKMTAWTQDFYSGIVNESEHEKTTEPSFSSVSAR